MELLGTSFIGSSRSGKADKTFSAFNPRESKPIAPVFYESSTADLEHAARLAAASAPILRNMQPVLMAEFLETIAEEILALGEELLARASAESGLDIARLTGERARTTNQLKMFASLVHEGSWVDARIETALPDRKPLPRPDLRRVLRGIGPVAVFGASNFPLAFSVAGGDTASALAAGNPVIVKGHPAHPGTSEMVAAAVDRAVAKCGFPEGTFSLLQSTEPAFSVALVSHPSIAAVGFTGSESAGRALFDAAAKRPVPIPVFAEMGSVNPIFLLPGALGERTDSIAEGIFKSVTGGVGQFCTCPGLVFAQDGPVLASLREKVLQHFAKASPGTMLTAGIAKAYEEKFQKAASVNGVESHRSTTAANQAQTEGQPGIAFVDFKTWAKNDPLQHEIFGPSTIIVGCEDEPQVFEAARTLSGNLTASVHASSADGPQSVALADLLSEKVGRVIFNGYPTGVEVGTAMQHGGPYPASTDSRFTSVGTASIYRFARPVSYQNCPQEALPAALRNENPEGILRLVNGEFTKSPV